MSTSVTVTELDQLKSELEKDEPDFENVRQIVSSNKHLLNEPIGNRDRNVLHYACWKRAPSNIVIEFINGNTLAVQQLVKDGDYPLHIACAFNQSESVIQLLVREYPLALQQKTVYGTYPLHLACATNQSESVIQLLVREYPLALQQKDKDGLYPLHWACQFNQSESVIQLLVKEYALAVQQKTINGDYPLHLVLKYSQCENVFLKIVEMFPQACKEEFLLHDACKHSKSETVLLVLINLTLVTVKHLQKVEGRSGRFETPLCIAERVGQSSTIIQVLKELMTISDSDLQNRIGIPKIVTLHSLDNLHRQDTFHWLLDNSPILIDGQYKQIM